MAQSTNDLPSTEQVADDVFLSPRVIDMKSFEGLEGRLRKVINHALETGKALVSLDEQTGESLSTLQSASPALDERAQAAASLLHSLDARVADAEALLGRALERAERAERFEVDVQATMERAEQAMQLRLDAKVADAEERMLGVQAEAAARITEMTSTMRQTIDDCVADARREADGLQARFDDANGRASATATDVEAHLAKLREEAHNIRTPALEMLHDLCDRAEGLLGTDPRADVPREPVAGSMVDLVNRGEKLRSDTETAIARFESIRQQTDQARKLLGDSLLESVEKIDALSDRQAALRSTIRESAGLCNQAETTMARSINELREAMEEPLKQANMASQRLTALIEQAGSSAGGVAEAMAKHQQTLTRVNEAVRRLEPWRGVLLEGVDDLPAPLTRVVERFRSEIGDDVGRIADGLHAIARRAEDVRTSVRE